MTLTLGQLLYDDDLEFRSTTQSCNERCSAYINMDGNYRCTRGKTSDTPLRDCPIVTPGQDCLYPISNIELPGDIYDHREDFLGFPNGLGEEL